MPKRGRKTYATARASKRRRVFRPTVGTMFGNRMRGRRMRSTRTTNVATYDRWILGNGETYAISSANANRYDAEGLSFNIGMLQDISTIVQLFDQYRILRVDFYIRMCIDPAANQPLNNATGSNTNNFYPDVYLTVDHDDVNTPTSVAYMLQYDKCKTAILRPNSWVKYRLHPTPLINTSGSGQMMGKSRQWIDCASTTVPFYGIKWIVDASNMLPSGDLVQNLYYEVKWKMLCQFKNQR